VLTRNILTNKTNEELQKDIKTLENALDKTKTKLKKLRKEYWHAEYARVTMQSAIKHRKMEIGKRRALGCPAFGQDNSHFYCDGKVGRPYSWDVDKLYLLCYDCKLPYEQIRTKMLILKLDGQDRKEL